MSSFLTPSHLRYTATHEWLQVDGGIATIGISDFAQDQLSDVVWVDLPEIGEEYAAGQTLVTVESVKAAADVYAPVSGVVTEVNEDLPETPELINQDPYGSWFVRMKIDEAGEGTELLDAAGYSSLTAE